MRFRNPISRRSSASGWAVGLFAVLLIRCFVVAEGFSFVGRLRGVVDVVKDVLVEHLPRQTFDAISERAVPLLREALQEHYPICHWAVLLLLKEVPEVQANLARRGARDGFIHAHTTCFGAVNIPDECALHLGGALYLDINAYDINSELRTFKVVSMYRPAMEAAWNQAAMRNYVRVVGASVRNCMEEFQRAPMDLSNVASCAYHATRANPAWPPMRSIVLGLCESLARSAAQGGVIVGDFYPLVQNPVGMREFAPTICMVVHPGAP